MGSIKRRGGKKFDNKLQKSSGRGELVEKKEQDERKSESKTNKEKKIYIKKEMVTIKKGEKA